MNTNPNSQSFCRCGNPNRAGQRTCKECHRLLERNYRMKARSELFKSRELFYDGVRRHDTLTQFHFKERIHTKHVLVSMNPGDVGYIGLPVGFLPNNNVVVLNDRGRLQKVQIKDIYNYGETSN